MTDLPNFWLDPVPVHPEAADMIAEGRRFLPPPTENAYTGSHDCEPGGFASWEPDVSDMAQRGTLTPDKAAPEGARDE